MNALALYKAAFSARKRRKKHSAADLIAMLDGAKRRKGSRKKSPKRARRADGTWMSLDGARRRRSAKRKTRKSAHRRRPASLKALIASLGKKRRAPKRRTHKRRAAKRRHRSDSLDALLFGAKRKKSRKKKTEGSTWAGCPKGLPSVIKAYCQRNAKQQAAETKAAADRQSRAAILEFMRGFSVGL